MRLTVDEITEIKVVSTDVDKEFMYFDRLDDGSWRLVYSKNMADRFVLHERTPKVIYVPVDQMTTEEFEEFTAGYLKRTKARLGLE